MSQADTPNTSAIAAAQDRDYFTATLAAYAAATAAYNAGPDDPPEEEQEAYSRLLDAAWALRPKTRSEGIAFASFLQTELDHGDPTDTENMADAVRAMVAALLTAPEPSAIAEQVSEARRQVENAQGDLRCLKGLFLMMADSIGPEANRRVELSGDDYSAAFYSLANNAEQLAAAFEEPVRLLMVAADAIEWRA